MIEKMEFISIMGPDYDMDRMLYKYLQKYDIHLENAVLESEILLNGEDDKEKGNECTTFIYENPYKQEIKLADRFVSNIDLSVREKLKNAGLPKLTIEEARKILEGVDNQLSPIDEEIMRLDTKIQALRIRHKNAEHYRGLDFDIAKVNAFKTIKCRFGKIPTEYFDTFKNYVYDKTTAIFNKCTEDDGYVYGVYFTLADESEEIDKIFSKLHFERFYMPDDYYGTPTSAYEEIGEKLKEHESKRKTLGNERNNILIQNAKELLQADNVFHSYSRMFETRKMAIKTSNKDNAFYMLCGWVSAKDKNKIAKETNDDPLVFLIGEDDKELAIKRSPTFEPPTKLNNIGLIKPFEFLTKVYGLPSYNEIDPTPILALTYALMFGAMFGDVGQGLLLVIAGLVMYIKTKKELPAMLAICGVSSTIFGFLFGSVFGFENVIPALWLRPMREILNLHSLGSINSVLVWAVLYGIILIFITMLIHIINGIRSKNISAVLFDNNSITGLVFYGTCIALLVMLLTGKQIIAMKTAGIILIVGLLIMLFREPITALLTKEKFKTEQGAGMWLVEGLLELFEILLSYFSNTVSFVRIGAFAISHVAMMEVVMMLSGFESGHPNIIVLILGNLFVIGMEGLVVAIQVLRLEYYEIFSRFYKGTGKEFTPYFKKQDI